MMAQTFNHRKVEGRDGGLWFEVPPWAKKLVRLYLKKQAWWYMPLISCRDRRIVAYGWSLEKSDPV
jgi:hypothetical protein